MKSQEKELIKIYAKKIVERNLSVAAIFFLESTKYISFVGGQALIFFGPLFTIFVNEKKYYNFIELLEKRENVEFLICEIENNANVNI
tara:strand:+ start:252 stop:515 length:264 start_codon:yes stop_codon:yes gene_type:complete